MLAASKLISIVLPVSTVHHVNSTVSARVSFTCVLLWCRRSRRRGAARQAQDLVAAFMPAPCELVHHVHDNRGDGHEPGRVAGGSDVPGGPERDRKNLGGSDQPPRDGLRNRLAHRDALPGFPTGPNVRMTLTAGALRAYLERSSEH